MLDNSLSGGDRMLSSLFSSKFFIADLKRGRLSFVFGFLLIFTIGVPVGAELPAAVDSAYLIPEVVALPFNFNTLSEAYLKQIKNGKLDLRRFSASLVERKRLFQERWGDNQTERSDSLFLPLDEVELVSFFPDKYLDSFIKNGQLNVHQTGHSRGLCDPEIRASAEDFMIGIHLEAHYDGQAGSKVHYIRPKYGLVNFLRNAEVMVNPNRLLRYGQIVLVYKDQVKQRATYSYGDSLVSYCEPWEKSHQPIEPVALTALLPPKPEFRKIRYVEAQIWGPLDLSDIKEFRVPEARTDLVEKLSKTGLPVYAYDRESMELRDEFVEVCDAGLNRGKTLSPALSAGKLNQAN